MTQTANNTITACSPTLKLQDTLHSNSIRDVERVLTYYGLRMKALYITPHFSIKPAVYVYT